MSHYLTLTEADLEVVRREGFTIRKYNDDELAQINKTGDFSMVDHTVNRPNKRDNV